MSRSTFRKGQSTFNCEDCGRHTRSTHGADTKICDTCYELAGLYNAFQDGELDNCGGIAACVIEATNSVRLGGDLDKIIAAYSELFPEGRAHFEGADLALIDNSATAQKRTSKFVKGKFRAEPNGKSFGLINNATGEWLLAAPSKRPGYPTPLRLFRTQEGAEKWLKAAAQG